MHKTIWYGGGLNKKAAHSHKTMCGIKLYLKCILFYVLTAFLQIFGGLRQLLKKVVHFIFAPRLIEVDKKILFGFNPKNILATLSMGISFPIIQVPSVA